MRGGEQALDARLWDQGAAPADASGCRGGRVCKERAGRSKTEPRGPPPYVFLFRRRPMTTSRQLSCQDPLEFQRWARAPSSCEFDLPASVLGCRSVLAPGEPGLCHRVRFPGAGPWCQCSCACTPRQTRHGSPLSSGQHRRPLGEMGGKACVVNDQSPPAPRLGSQTWGLGLRRDQIM